jgi:hypothetical protein
MLMRGCLITDKAVLPHCSCYRIQVACCLRRGLAGASWKWWLQPRVSQCVWLFQDQSGCYACRGDAATCVACKQAYAHSQRYALPAPGARCAVALPALLAFPAGLMRLLVMGAARGKAQGSPAFCGQWYCV